MESLGRRRQMFATVVLLLGLLSFFLPLIKTAPPVMGRTLWSPWDITVEMCGGQLPPTTSGGLGARLFSIPIMISTIYVLQIVALLAVALRRSSAILKSMAAIGVFTSWFWRGDRVLFEELFYGNFSYRDFSLVRRVSFGQHTLILLGMMGILWFIATNDDLDAEQSSGRRQLQEKGDVPQEPEILDAEILPPEDGTRQESQGKRRLRQ